MSSRLKIGSFPRNASRMLSISGQRLCDAQAARAARLSDLRVAAARVAAVGEYYKLRYRSTWATYGGVVCGLLATAAIVAAFAWPLH